MKRQALTPTTIDDPLAVATPKVSGGRNGQKGRVSGTANTIGITTGTTGSTNTTAPTTGGIIGSTEPENEPAGIISPIGQSTAFEASPTYTGTGSQAYEVTQDEMVSEQLDRLLNKNNSYLQRARASAAQQANSRGLLNSSLAAGAGEAAAIDAALPIAQQDAGYYQALGQAKQQGIIDSFQRAQAAKDQAGLYGTQSAYESLLSKQESGQQSEIQKQIDAAAMGRLSAELASKSSLQSQQIKAELEMQANEIAAQFGLADMENELKQYLAELELTSNEKIALSGDTTKLTQQFMQEATSILNNTEISNEGKWAAYNALQERFNAGISLGASVFDSIAVYEDNTASVKSSIASAYQTYLGRPADEAGLNYYTDLVASGKVSLNDVINGLVSSEEGQAYNTTEKQIYDYLTSETK